MDADLEAPPREVAVFRRAQELGAPLNSLRVEVILDRGSRHHLSSARHCVPVGSTDARAVGVDQLLEPGALECAACWKDLTSSSSGPPAVRTVFVRLDNLFAELDDPIEPRDDLRDLEHVMGPLDQQLVAAVRRFTQTFQTWDSWMDSYDVTTLARVNDEFNRWVSEMERRTGLAVTADARSIEQHQEELERIFAALRRGLRTPSTGDDLVRGQLGQPRTLMAMLARMVVEVGRIGPLTASNKVVARMPRALRLIDAHPFIGHQSAELLDSDDLGVLEAAHVLLDLQDGVSTGGPTLQAALELARAL